MNTLIIRNATLDDLPVMKVLYADTILAVCRKDYTEAQAIVWASSVHNEERWLDMVVNQYVLIAESKNVLLGFGTLRDHNYIDFFYVHKDYQKRGIAGILLEQLLQKAIAEGELLVTSDVSMTARSFFEKNAFKVVAEQNNVRGDEVLINYKMIRHLPDTQRHSDLKGVFMLDATFKITGRGLVLTGRLIDGDISSGDRIVFYKNGIVKDRRVLGVQMPGRASREPSMLGLLVRCENEEEIEELRSWNPDNEIARIYKANG